MSRFISNLATLLLAPIILSATCLLCFVQTAPVYAASVARTQVQACSETQTRSQTFTKKIAPSNDQAMTASGINVVTQSNHDSGCKSMTNHLGTRVNGKNLTLNEDHSVLFADATTTYQIQDQNHLSTLFYKTVPIKNDFLTGIIIKRE